MRAGGGDADRGVRIGQVAGGGVQRAISAWVPASSSRKPWNTVRTRCQAACGTPFAGLAEAAHRAAVAAASRSSSSNSRRSKLELTWMSMLGDRLGSTGRADMSLAARKRARMSLRLEPAIRRATGSPMRRATQAARMLPKLPVGTLKATSRSGAPSASAAAT